MWVAIVVLVAALTTLVLANRPNPKRRFERQSITSIVLSAISGVLITASGASALAFGLPDAQLQQLRFGEQVQARYGVALNLEQAKALKYPWKKPDRGLQTYGTTTLETKVQGDLYRKQKVQLISEDGKFKLAHYEEDKGFEELPRKGTNR